MLQLTHFSNLPAPRRGQGKRYDLPHVLLCCILAVAAGADSYRAITRFIEARFDWLKTHTGLAWKHVPSHTGLRAILLGLDQDAVEQIMRQRAADCAQTSQSSIAIDGKTLRGSLDRFADVSALQWLSAFATEERLVLGQIALADGDKAEKSARRSS